MRFLITGSAGFIGFHVARRLLARGDEVHGVDSMTPYYDVKLKACRHEMLAQSERFKPHITGVEDLGRLTNVAREAAPEIIIHLAAQAGVRYSIENPRAYIDSNVIGTFNVLEIAREFAVRHLLLASTSSVYGGNQVMPFRENERTDHPLTLYAATKKSTELMAHSYAHLWGVPTTVMRFFTVYGPWGRPDMALFKFVEAVLNDRPIDVYGYGRMSRDFTYVDDVAEAVVRLTRVPPVRETAEDTDTSYSSGSVAPFRIVNVGGGAPVKLLAFVEEVERCLGKRAVRNMLPMQLGDVPHTCASGDALQRLTGFTPRTTVPEGVRAFVDWYRSYYGSLPS